MKYLIATLIFGASVLLSGCQTPVQATPIITQEVLLESCSDDTPLPTIFVLDEKGQKGYNGKEVLNVLTAWDKIYRDCNYKHEALINTIRKLQDQNIKVSIKVK